mmetsp:Transcript_6677/g.17185  ORF Transcript_6677/g.17185 Transcript_6677/m.17185 type:complete len:281 (-) Transcript_6677:138-980(-)
MKTHVHKLGKSVVGDRGALTGAFSLLAEEGPLELDDLAGLVQLEGGHPPDRDVRSDAALQSREQIIVDALCHLFLIRAHHAMYDGNDICSPRGHAHRRGDEGFKPPLSVPDCRNGRDDFATNVVPLRQQRSHHMLLFFILAAVKLEGVPRSRVTSSQLCDAAKFRLARCHHLNPEPDPLRIFAVAVDRLGQDGRRNPLGGPGVNAVQRGRPTLAVLRSFPAPPRPSPTVELLTNLLDQCAPFISKRSEQSGGTVETHESCNLGKSGLNVKVLLALLVAQL